MSSESLDKISFHIESIDFELDHKEVLATWVGSVFVQEEKAFKNLSYIFCSDDYLHKMNVEYLQHDTLTDVITFPYSPPNKPIEGDIFISVDRVKENAIAFETTFMNELHRVMVHGALHLIGYGDKNKEEVKKIRSKEDFYLAQFTL